MTDDWLRPLGDTGLVVSAIGAGGGPLGSMPDTVGRVVPADEGVATARRILAGPITFLDTSNNYGVNGHVDVFACGHRRSSLVAIESLRV
jgi:D-threo-aldose 1-dehydrogenase